MSLNTKISSRPSSWDRDMTGLDDDEETNLTAMNLDIENDEEEEEENEEEEEEEEEEKEENEEEGIEIVDELEELDRLEREMRREEKPGILDDMMDE